MSKDVENSILISRAQVGDPDAVNTLIALYVPVVRSTVIYMLRGDNDCDDVVQDSLIQLLNSINIYSFQSSFKTFVTRIAMNVSIDSIRRRQCRYAYYEAYGQEKSQLYYEEESYLTGDCQCRHSFMQGDLINQALMSLHPNHRVVIGLRYLQGFSTEETAHILGVKAGTVLSRLDRAKKKLQALLNCGD